MNYLFFKEATKLNLLLLNYHEIIIVILCDTDL